MNRTPARVRRGALLGGLLVALALAGPNVPYSIAGTTVAGIPRLDSQSALLGYIAGHATSVVVDAESGAIVSVTPAE